MHLGWSACGYMRCIFLIVGIVATIVATAHGFSIQRGLIKPTSRMTNLRSVSMASNLRELCDVTKEACDVVSPMLQAFYKEIRIAAGEDSTAKLKSDATFFTIADGIVQHMFIEVRTK